MFIQLKNSLALILDAARWRSLPQSSISVVVTICVALAAKSFSTTNALLAFISVISLHLAANLYDDFFDYIQGVVPIRNQIKSGRALKCSYIIDNNFNEKQIFLLASFFASIAVLIGLYFLFTIGLPIIIFILIGGFLIIFYSAPPLKLSYRGLGELIIGLMFGPILCSGVFFVTTGYISEQIIIVSIITGLLTTNIVYVHSIADLEADIACNKTTLAVLLKNDFLRFFALFIFTILPFGISFFISNTLGYLCLITLPVAVYLLFVMRDKKRHKILFKLLPKRLWKLAIKSGNEYFYTRWLLSRDYMTAFVSILSLFFIYKAITLWG